MTLTDRQRDELDERGWAVLPGVLAGDHLRRVLDRVEQLFDEEGEAAGSEFRAEEGARRLANLVDKDPLFGELLVEPGVVAGASHVLGEDYKLSSFNARSTNPHTTEPQPLHCDGGVLPDDRGFMVFNTIWLLDDFTPDNGPTRVVPGSHRWGKLPQDLLDDPLAPHPDEVHITGPAGSVVLMNTHAWHGGTANRTDAPRRALHGFFCRRDHPQQQYQKALLSPRTQERLSPELRRICALDDPLNDRVSAAGERASGFLG